MQGSERLDAAMALLADAPCRPSTTRDADLLEAAERWEALGRLVDARRIALAGEIEWRSRDQIGTAGLARSHGDRNGAELIARELRIGAREAQRRTGFGLRLRSRLSMQGEELPGLWPRVAAALEAGTIGQDATRVIVEALGAI